MDEEKQSTEEERRLLEMFQRAALNDFPNPQRADCPGMNFLRRLAHDRKSISLSDPALTHIARCSPCFREYRALRDNGGKPTISLKLLAMASIGIVVLSLGVLFFTHSFEQ